MRIHEKISPSAGIEPASLNFLCFSKFETCFFWQETCSKYVRNTFFWKGMFKTCFWGKIWVLKNAFWRSYLKHFFCFCFLSMFSGEKRCSKCFFIFYLWFTTGFFVSRKTTSWTIFCFKHVLFKERNIFLFQTIQFKQEKWITK